MFVSVFVHRDLIPALSFVAAGPFFIFDDSHIMLILFSLLKTCMFKV